MSLLLICKMFSPVFWKTDMLTYLLYIFHCCVLSVIVNQLVWREAMLPSLPQCSSALHYYHIWVELLWQQRWLQTSFTGHNKGPRGQWDRWDRWNMRYSANIFVHTCPHTQHYLKVTERTLTVYVAYVIFFLTFCLSYISNHYSHFWK